MPTDIPIRLAALAALILAVAGPLALAVLRMPPGRRARPAGPDATPAPDDLAAARETAVLAALAQRAGPLAHLAHVALTAAAGIVAVLAVWALAEPARVAGLVSAIVSGAAAGDSPLEGISWRFLTSGALGLMALIWLAGALEAALAESFAARPALIWLDPPLRLALTALVTAAVFALYAVLFDAFGGEWRNAIRAVPGSLATALAGGALSAVTVWAGLISGLPLALAPAMAEGRERATGAALRLTLAAAVTGAAAATGLALLR